jgi:glycine cleavage system transcriptional repressor
MIVTIRSMTQLALTAIGRDRPGIVAEVTRALLGHSLNITDSQMAVLGGRFSMMLIVVAPEGTDLDAVREELARTRSRLDLDAVALHPLAEAELGAPADPSHIVTVYGVDHPGIVHAVAAALAGADVNITDLNTRLVSDDPRENGDGADDLYAMMLEVSLPPGLSASALQTLLEATRRDQDVEVTIRELESDEL